jgi:DNA-binding transcriptional LysR family regulator
MDLNEIVVFAKVVETRSFTAAAQQLGLPKSTVSRKVAQLEERLGVRLLQRTTRKLSLTEIGQTYFERCQRIVSDIMAAEQVVTDMQSTPRGLLRVTAPVDLGAFVLGGVVSEFLTEYNDIHVELGLTDRVVDLVDEGIDLGIRFGPLQESTLIARKLTTVDMRLCASPAYLARRGMPAHPDDLDVHDIIAFVPIPRLATWILHGPDGTTAELTPSARFTCNNLMAIRDAVHAGAGIGQLPEYVCGECNDGFVHVLPDWRAEPAELYAVYPSTRNTSPKLRAFVEFLALKLAHPPWRSIADRADSVGGGAAVAPPVQAPRT